MTNPPKTTDPSSPRPRWRLRFSLRTWLILVSLLCLLFVYLGRVERQRRAVGLLKAAGMHVDYTDRISSLRDLSGSLTGQNPYEVEVPFLGENPDFVEGIRLVGIHQISFVGSEEGAPHTFDLSVLSSLTGLERLALGLKGFRDEDMRHVAPHSGLKSLTLELTMVSDDGVKQFANLTQLSHLRLPWRTTDAGLASLNRLKNLEHLNLSATAVSDAGLKHLSAFPRLHTLDLSEMSGVSGSGLKHLASLPCLRVLNLYGTQIDDDALQVLVSLPQLEELDLMDCPITDRGLLYIAQCKNLTELNLENSHFSDEGITHLRRLPKLRMLRLGRARISRRALSELEQFPSLEQLILWLSGTELQQPERGRQDALNFIQTNIIARWERNETLRGEANQSH